MSSGGADSWTEISFMKTFTQRSSKRVKIPKNLLQTVLEGNSYRNHICLSCNVTPGMLWGADLRGRKITHGWQEFTEENSFEFGDLLVFKYNGSTRFHVEMHRPNAGNRGNVETTEDEAELVTLTVTADNIQRSRMYLPQVFCEDNFLHQFAGKTIYMVGDSGDKFVVKLNAEKFKRGPRFRLTNGLREFFEANNIRENDEISMGLLWDEGSAPTLKLRSKVIVVS